MPDRVQSHAEVGGMPGGSLFGSTSARPVTQEPDVDWSDQPPASPDTTTAPTAADDQAMSPVAEQSVKEPVHTTLRDLEPPRGKSERRRVTMPRMRSITWWKSGLVLLILIVMLVTSLTMGFPMASPFAWALYGVAWAWFVYVTLVQRRVDKTIDRPRPNRGWQFLLYRFFRLTGVTFVPKRSKRDLNDVEKKRQFLLAGERSAFVCAFGPKGGVGKSTVITSMAWHASGCNYVTNVLLDARIKRGQITERMGLWRREDPTTPARHTTVTIRQFMQLDADGWFDHPVQESLLLGSPPGRQLLTVASDMVTHENDLELDPELLKSSIRNTGRRNPLVFAECSDDLFTPMDLMLMEACDIPVLVHRVDSPGSTSELSQGVQMYANRSASFMRKIKEHAVLMVLASKRGQKPEDFFEVFHGLVPVERIYLVKSHKFFKQDHTDPGHDTKNKRDLTRPPRRTMEVDGMPLDAEFQYRRALNDAMETLSVLQLNPVRAADGSEPS